MPSSATAWARAGCSTSSRSEAATLKYEISVFGEEQGGAYNRILLGKVLAGEAPDSIVTKTPEWYDQNNIRLIDRSKVTQLDTLRKRVETDDGKTRGYDVAVLATGSQPLVPRSVGCSTRTASSRWGRSCTAPSETALRMRCHARAGDAAVVVGGGLLGLEAAKVLADLGLHVTVVHVAQPLMNAQLDAIGGDMLTRQIERTGIFVKLGRTVEAVYGDDSVQGVFLDDGTRLSADMIVLACGVRPRIDVARASGLPVNRAIIVNDSLATEVASVYAFGECAEHRGRTYGIVAPVWEQAAALADVLTGPKPRHPLQGLEALHAPQGSGYRGRIHGLLRTRSARTTTSSRSSKSERAPTARSSCGKVVSSAPCWWATRAPRHPRAALRSRRSRAGRSARSARERAGSGERRARDLQL